MTSCKYLIQIYNTLQLKISFKWINYVSKMKNKTSINILHEVNQFENVKLEIIFFNEILNINTLIKIL